MVLQISTVTWRGVAPGPKAVLDEEAIVARTVVVFCSMNQGTRTDHRNQWHSSYQGALDIAVVGNADRRIAPVGPSKVMR